MTLTASDRERMTVGQKKKLDQIRECPSCPGILERFEVYREDRKIIERYHHAGGNDGCEGNDPNNGFWSPAGNYVIHYPDDVSAGGGVLEGDFE